MKDDYKSSTIREALTDYNAIMEAADANAKKKLVEEFPENFKQLMKEEINKNKTAKESYKKLDNAQESKKLDETEFKKESDMKNQVKETVKVVDTVGKGKPFETKAKKVEEDVKVTNTIGKNDPFTDKKVKAKIEEEREKDFMGDIEGETPNQGKGGAEKGDRFTEKIKGPSSGKPISNLKEEFNISELDMSSIGEALEGAEDEDDIITIDEIDNEISQMEGLGDSLPRPELGGKRGSPSGRGGDAFNQLVSMRNQIDEIIEGMGGSKPEEEYQPEEEEYQPEEESFSIEEELFETDEITDDDINSVLGSAPEESVDEAKGISYSDGSITPGKLGDHEGTHGRFRQTESKKLGTLIEENKKLTKKLNETKKYKQSATTLLESYKTAVEKYRNQLKEMAIFNTNLAHVNNLLVNESLALTHDDKIKIINEFKKVDSISESQEKYKSFLSEMKESKKTISESLETKVSASILPSSKQKLDEVIEKTAYTNDPHIQKMRNLIEYVENRGKKIIK